MRCERRREEEDKEKRRRGRKKIVKLETVTDGYRHRDTSIGRSLPEKNAAVTNTWSLRPEWPRPLIPIHTLAFFPTKRTYRLFLFLHRQIVISFLRTSRFNSLLKRTNITIMIESSLLQVPSVQNSTSGANEPSGSLPYTYFRFEIVK